MSDAEEDAVTPDPAPFLTEREIGDMVAFIKTTLFVALGDPSTLSRKNERALEADDMARTLLMDFCHRAMNKAGQSERTIKWLSDAFMALLDHENAEQPLHAFGMLPRAKGKPKDSMKPFDVAAWVLVAIRRGYKKAEAKSMAADVFHIELKQVERHIRDQGLTPEMLSPDEGLWDIHFNIPGRDKPARPLPKPRRI